MALPNITVSGTDPTNPRCMAHIVTRLEQIERDTAAMRQEAGRLMMFAGRGRDVLLDHGRTDNQARAVVTPIVDKLRRLHTALHDVSGIAATAAGMVRDSGIPLNTRFEWRPTSGR